MNRLKCLRCGVRISLVVFIVGVHSATATIEAQADNSGESKYILDNKLRALLHDRGVGPIDNPQQDEAVVALGQALFFDRILSGNQDTACATCHHPLLATGDGLSLPVGTGPRTVGAIGVMRERGPDRAFVPRNAPEVFNRGSESWRTQFWDSRIEETLGILITPAGPDLPDGLTGVLAAQAMFPVTSRDEMRGSLADVTRGNELAPFDDNDLQGIWDALMTRLLSIDGYRTLFANAYPDLAEGELGFQDAANAIAAFEAAAFGYVDSPFDEYLRGNNAALSQAEKRGAMLFYNEAGCADCHSGTLLTDQQHHNIGVPQLGPGKDPVSGLDLGRFGVTGDISELYRFRTPPLRNVAATGPWMHNGAYRDLEDAVGHVLDPAKALRRYKPEKQLDQQELRETVVEEEFVLDDIVDRLDISPVKLSGKEMKDLLTFLDSLTVPDLEDRLLATIPDDVPSGMVENGLPVMLQP